MSPKKAAYSSPNSRSWLSAIAVSLVGIFLAGCVTTYEKRGASIKKTELLQTDTKIAEAELLEVRISTFDPGKISEEDGKSKDVSKKIRQAEGYFISTKLRDAMQSSGQWGPVRVVPRGKNDGEVAVTGEILESDGEILKVKVRAADATGLEWFEKEYEAVVDESMYQEASRQRTDVFQSLYNKIANDIAAHRLEMSKSRIARIRQVAELKFAAEFAPDLYGQYLKAEKTPASSSGSNILAGLFSAVKPTSKPKDTGPIRIVRLPANNDPSFQRIKRIRARENQLIETLDQQYDGLSRSIEGAYTQWRTARLTEMNAVRKAEQLENERAGKAIITGLIGTALIVAGANSNNNCPGCGSAATTAGAVVLAKALQDAIELSETAGADRKLHQIALEELGQSLASEVSPIVLEIEGEVVELKGSVEDKFQQWRVIMTKLHQKEVGPLDKVSFLNNSNTRLLR